MPTRRNPAEATTIFASRGRAGHLHGGKGRRRPCESPALRDPTASLPLSALGLSSLLLLDPGIAGREQLRDRPRLGPGGTDLLGPRRFPITLEQLAAKREV